MSRRKPKTQSINQKLTRLVVLSISTACLIMGGLACWQELSGYASAKQGELQSASNAFAAAAANAVASRDRASALQALRGIAALPSYQYAAVRDLSNVVVAEVGSGARLLTDLAIAGETAPISPVGLFMTGTLSVETPIRSNGRIVGHLQLVSDTTEVRARLITVAFAALAGAGVALSVGLVISLRMQRALTGPLVRLTSVMAGIRSTQSYDHQIDLDGDDEIGVLARTFREMMQDVRDRDERLVRHQLRLEADVADRTREVVAAKGQADEANAAKSDFLATMSHEIRTPLNGLLVMADLLAKADLPPRHKRYAQVIAQSGHGLLTIINDILDFSKIEAGKLTLEHIAFDPADVVDRTINLHSARAHERGLDLACFIAPDVPHIIEGDPARLGQILSNIVGNAIKFTPAGSVVVRLERSGDTLVFSVIDTGIGIPQSKLDSIFSAFSQAEQSTSRRYGGTGLGLSICRRLAEAMGADIRVSSQPAAGTTFSVTLKGIEGGPLEHVKDTAQTVFVGVRPIATRRSIMDMLAAFGHLAVESPLAAAHVILEADDVAALASRPVPGMIVALQPPHAALDLGKGAIVQADLTVPTPLTRSDWFDILSVIAGRGPVHKIAASEPASVHRARFGHLRVLVVDDSELNIEVAAEAFAQLGVQAETALSGAEAIDRIRAVRYDLVLMDGSMPGMDGYTATRLIRDYEARTMTARTRIVALTAHVIGPAAEAWASCGMDGFIHKPFTIEALARALDGIDDDRATTTVSVADPSPQSKPLFDPEILGNLRDMGQRSNGTFLSRLVDLFVAACPSSLTAMREAAGNHDAIAVAAAAHQLKSMSLNIGAQVLAEMLGTVEADARTQGLVPSDEFLSRLAGLADATSLELKTVFAPAVPAVLERLAG